MATTGPNDSDLRNPTEANTPNQSRTPEHAEGANAPLAENPAPVVDSGLNTDPTTSSQVAARVNTGKTGHAQGVGIAVANLSAETVIATIKAAKGSLDMVTNALTDLVKGIDEIGDTELSNVQVYIDQAQQHLNGLLHTAKASQENAHTPASKSS